MDKMATITATATTTTTIAHATNTKEKSRRPLKYNNKESATAESMTSDCMRSAYTTQIPGTAIATDSDAQPSQQHNPNHHRNYQHRSTHNQYYPSTNAMSHHDKNNDSFDDDDDADDNYHDDVDNDDFVAIKTAHTQTADIDDVESYDSIETAESDELPVWAFGEQRWISGVNEDTTCADLISVLLADEGIQLPAAQRYHNQHKATSFDPDLTISKNAGANTTTKAAVVSSTTATAIPNSVDSSKIYVITERWRRVEQILSEDTRVLQIWSAWGQAKSEVKLTLRQIDPSLALDTSCYSNNDKDSGMGSPNGSSNSAIMRRRKHRAIKSTAAWVTQANTMHPKSQKSQIEKLMKLILEQGETIQQQLAKLRDRELQIAKIEEERHKHREREHGKNYLLETYLNGLHEVEEKEVVTGNSDSGVQTEGALSSPEICSSSNPNEDDDYLVHRSATAAEAESLEEQSTTMLASLPTPKLSKHNPKYVGISNKIKPFALQSSTTTHSNSNGNKASSAYDAYPFKEKPSHREKKLLKEHKQAKEYSTYLLQQSEAAQSRDFASFGQHRVAAQPNHHEQTKNFSTHLMQPTSFASSSDGDVNNRNQDIVRQQTAAQGADESKEDSNCNILGQDIFHSTRHGGSNLHNDTADANAAAAAAADDADPDVGAKIQWMEKLVMINKHLQREEELLVRLGAKIRKYESENPLLDETQIREALSKVNNHLETGNMEIEKLELDLLSTKEQLEKKSNLLHTLNKQLVANEKEVEERMKKDAVEIDANVPILNQAENERPAVQSKAVEEKKIDKKKSDTRKVGFSNSIRVVDIPLDDDDDDVSESENVDGSTNKNLNGSDVSLKLSERIEVIAEINNNESGETNFNKPEVAVGTNSEGSKAIYNTTNLRENNLVENLYNYSQYIAKPNYDFNEKNENRAARGSEEKLPPTVTFADTCSTLPLRSKSSAGILKNKNAPTYILSDESTVVWQPSQTQSAQVSPCTAVLAPPARGFDSPNLNGQNTATASPVQTSLGIISQSRSLSGTQTPLGFSYDQARNLNLTKSAPIVQNSKNINPAATSKFDGLLPKPLYFLEQSQSKSVATNSRATAIAAIDRSLKPYEVQPKFSNRQLLAENYPTLRSNYMPTNLPSPANNNSINFLQRQQQQQQQQHTTNCGPMNIIYPSDLSASGDSTQMLLQQPQQQQHMLTNPNRIATIQQQSGLNGVHNGFAIAATMLDIPAYPNTATTENAINNCIYSSNNANNSCTSNNTSNRNANVDILNSSNVICSTMTKLAPKRFMHTGSIGTSHTEFNESNSDTGLSSLSDDVTQLGTLV